MKFVSNTLKYVGVFFLGMGLMSPSVWGQKLFNPGEKIDKTIHKTMGWPSQAQQDKVTYSQPILSGYQCVP